MGKGLPRFNKPPVVETTMSAQFARLAGYTTGHAGAFWKSHLAKLPGGEAWTQLKEAPRIEDAFERLGEESWQSPHLKFAPAAEAQRIQIVREGEERMVQVQDTRFILNWQKQTGAYPTFEILSGEFPPLFEAFESFAKESGFGPLELNQWEMTYVNRIPKGDMWETCQDWRTIIPTAVFPPAAPDSVRGETFSGSWRYAISDRARMYVSLRHVRVGTTEDEAIQLVFTARGPVDRENAWTLASGFELGHEAIVRSFATMTSTKAHDRWERTG
jgi:uncharacterized protein (TIGR04255 family)